MAQTEQQDQGGSGASEDPRVSRAKARAGGDKGREMIEHLQQGATLDPDEEVDALEYLLGAPAPIIYDVTVQLDTPRGSAPLTFVFRNVDGRKLDEIEQRHANQATGQVDRLAADLGLIVYATQHLENHLGREVDLKSDAFLTVPVRGADGGVEKVKMADPAIALERRMTGQHGLAQGVAREIRRVSGWDAERQGQAQRRLAKAALD